MGAKPSTRCTARVFRRRTADVALTMGRQRYETVQAAAESEPKGASHGCCDLRARPRVPQQRRGRGWPVADRGRMGLSGQRPQARSELLEREARQLRHARAEHGAALADALLPEGTPARE